MTAINFVDAGEVRQKIVFFKNLIMNYGFKNVFLKMLEKSSCAIFKFPWLCGSGRDGWFSDYVNTLEFS